MRSGFQYGNRSDMEALHPLRQWRADKALKQEAAAQLLGIKTPTLSRYETGARTPSLTQAAKLSEKTGIPLDRFVKASEAAE